MFLIQTGENIILSKRVDKIESLSFLKIEGAYNSRCLQEIL
jgi:hypothetical protein